jgi:ABC-type multidrug transport system ATPase subunit
MNGIEAQHLRRSFGSVLAVADVSFEAPVGKITALIGPNGSGKTTLMLMLAGLLHPDGGHARVGGHDLLDSPYEARVNSGWMPDTLGTWDALTCTEILKAFGRAYGVSSELSVRRAAFMLDMVHLSDYADSPARVLSRGQKQRLSLARALVHDPEVVLLDEPASGLDPLSRVDLRDLLRALANAGKTILVSSHVLSELDQIADEAVFLQNGKSVDVDAKAQTLTQRGWRLEAADGNQLKQFLNDRQVQWRPGTGSPNEVIIDLPDQDAAIALNREAALAGIGLYTITPVSGRLEEAYLHLSEDRR